MSKHWMGLCALLIVSMMTTGLYAGDNIFKGGDFEAENPKKPGTPAHWGINPEKGSSWETEGENKFLRLTSMESGKMYMVYRQFFVKPADYGKKMKMTFKMRCNGIEKGQKSWFSGTLFIQFKNSEGKKIKGVSKIPRMAGTHAEWEDKVLEFEVPEGAEKFEVMPVLFNVKAGTMDFDDFTLEYVD
ncbi:MAG TPA: hypothetical protein DCM28_18625 [Phycisphaerales bacterium]|nr:hypothetical protein [Phycisphaerales bacterium]HCD31694.1 hypothetical protein [Phycisphaerales bacterium]|tara:strand:+ start:616 stop:1176 length:561 start_codon:yes stop_codon:yes gene_type:complete